MYVTVRGCGPVGRAVASDARGSRFESSHRQKLFNIEHLYTGNCVIEKTKIKKTRPGMAHFLIKTVRVFLKFVYDIVSVIKRDLKKYFCYGEDSINLGLLVKTSISSTLSKEIF